MDNNAVAGTANSVMNGNTWNLCIVAGIIVFVVVVFIICIKKKLIIIGTKNIKVGLTEQTTRELIRQQFDYVQNAIQMFVSLMEKTDDFNEYKARYASEKVLDEMNRWIVFNNISDNDFYIENKQTIIWNILQGIGQKEEYKSETFRTQCNKAVERIIKQLLKIKEYYENGNP